MSIIPHHTSDTTCALCEMKLKDAHSTLCGWFHAMKEKHPDLHISWSYRDEASQEQSFKEGKTRLHFPMSAHNKTPAMAIDIFQIDDSGRAKWDPVFCAKLNDESTAAGYSLKWGGFWKTLGDNDHFEINLNPEGA